MDLLIPSTGLLFWMTLVFIVVLIVMWYVGIPAISKMVLERKQFIDDSLRKAEEAEEKLANIQKESEALLQAAREKQADILKDAKTTHDSIVSKAETDAREQANKLIAEAKSQIEAEKASAIREIRSQVAELSVQIAEKVVRRNLSGETAQMELIDKLLDEVSVEK
ncbi:MAG: F0F1 ATP synthase subunit B [Prevotella sp.]|jgi:F-type H+-transporting ATPase subunit b|nr:F0F1 ATP synthase subunit B [Prevotella sp.]